MIILIRRVRTSDLPQKIRAHRAIFEALLSHGAGAGLATVQTAVECWIGVVLEADRRVVRLAGRLSAAQVPELASLCAEPGPVELDLTELVSADVAGIEALRRCRAKGAAVVGAAGYIQLKLDSRPD